MKAILVQWTTRPANMPDWFQHGNEIDITWDQIRQLYEAGANIMIKHDRLGGDVTAMVCVDDRGFSQR